MKNLLKTTVVCLAAACLSATAFAGTATKPVTHTKPITVGIVVPIGLPAMTQIVAGLKAEVKKQSTVPVRFVIKNAQGDPSLQRSILEEFKESNVNIVAPIGTDASQMAIAMIHNKPIVGIAAEHLKAEAEAANNPNVTGDLDQISISKQIQFMHAALPKIKKFTVIYSTAGRIYSQVKQVIRASNALGMKVQKLMMMQLSDLYSVSKNIATNSQAIFILKDEMIVSGVNTLLDQAYQKNIPLIASDDGSVSKGAAFALGVSEHQIGVDAGKQIMKIIDGKKAGALPVYIMSHYYVFLNPVAAKKQHLNPDNITLAAKKMGYPVTIL